MFEGLNLFSCVGAGEVILRPDHIHGPPRRGLISAFQPLEAPDPVTLGLPTSGKQVTRAHWG